MKKERKTHFISEQLLDFRLADRTCPVCLNGCRIIRVLKMIEDPSTGEARPGGGAYWVCENHRNDWDHYNLSPGGGDKCTKPRESIHAYVPERLRQGYVEPGRTCGHVIKRSPDGQHTIVR